MPTNRRKLRLNTVTVNLGCRCRRPKLSDIFNPKPKAKTTPVCRRPDTYRSSSSSWEKGGCSTDQDDTTTTFSPNVGTSSDYSETDYEAKSSKKMILEKEIYSKDDLRELLNCFLQLNSPYYHGVIVRAFTEIWNGVFSVRSASPKPHGSRKSRDF
ncbi:Transcription repressor OFP6 [Vitis vinifera]|uniref:Transcription repressor n=1 Tax=Vitis vinifera TaxID=29760 RepID=A0A438CC50_VITVI|nr:Transcription repressor OFP6 [Vitis vinifera]